MAQRSEDVANALLHLATTGETAVVASFISSDANRFNALANKGHLGILMETLARLDNAQQTTVLAASESISYGAPNATVLQTIVASRDPVIVDRLQDVLNGLNTSQHVNILSAPNAVWWLGAYDQDKLVCDLSRNLSANERQTIADRADNLRYAIDEICSSELTGLFKDCTFKTKPAPAPGA